MVLKLLLLLYSVILLNKMYLMEGCPWLLQTQNVQLTCHPLTHLLSL